MPNSIKVITLLFLLGINAPGSTPKTGERAPQFSLPSADGRTISLKDYAGRKLVLVFYRGNW